MANQIVVVDTASGVCGRATLRPYPTVTSVNSSVTVTSSVSAEGGTVFNLAVPAVATPAVSVLTDTNDGHVIATHTAGGVSTNIEESITTLATSGASLVYTNEAGTVATVPICTLLQALPDSGIIGG